MISFAFLLLSVALLVACIKLFGVGPQVRCVIAATKEATAAMASAVLSDEQKETAVRRAALQVFGRFCSITLRAALTLAIPIAFVAAGAATSLYTVHEAIDGASNWGFIIASSLIVATALAVLR